MSHPAPVHATLDDWIAREAIPFSIDSPEMFHPAVDKMVACLGDSVELPGFGEALHGGEENLLLRSRLFEPLVETPGHGAIPIESSSPRLFLLRSYCTIRPQAGHRRHSLSEPAPLI